MDVNLQALSTFISAGIRYELLDDAMGAFDLERHLWGSEALAHRTANAETTFANNMGVDFGGSFACKTR